MGRAQVIRKFTARAENFKSGFSPLEFEDVRTELQRLEVLSGKDREKELSDIPASLPRPIREARMYRETWSSENAWRWLRPALGLHRKKKPKADHESETTPTPPPHPQQSEPSQLDASSCDQILALLASRSGLWTLDELDRMSRLIELERMTSLIALEKQTLLPTSKRPVSEDGFPASAAFNRQTLDPSTVSQTENVLRKEYEKQTFRTPAHEHSASEGVRRPASSSTIPSPAPRDPKRQKPDPSPLSQTSPIIKNEYERQAFQPTSPNASASDGVVSASPPFKLQNPASSTVSQTECILKSEPPHLGA